MYFITWDCDYSPIKINSAIYASPNIAGYFTFDGKHNTIKYSVIAESKEFYIFTLLY